MFWQPMPLICNKRSATLFEVVISALIFALVMAGMASVFVAGKRQVLHFRERMVSSEMGKYFLEPFQLSVRQDTWDTASNALRLVGGNYITYCDSDSGHTQNPACPSVVDLRKVNNVEYSAKYDVSKVSGVELRRVKAQITWTEFSP